MSTVDVSGPNRTRTAPDSQPYSSSPGLDVSDTKLDPLMFRNIVLMNLLMMDTYMPALLAVIHGGIVPSIAVEKTENGELAELVAEAEANVAAETEAEA